MVTSSHQWLRSREASAPSATRLSPVKRLSTAHVSTLIQMIFLSDLSAVTQTLDTYEEYLKNECRLFVEEEEEFTLLSLRYSGIKFNKAIFKQKAV